MGFLLSPIRDNQNVVYLGGSITNGSLATNNDIGSYRALTRRWLIERQYTTPFTFYNSSAGGTGSWYALTRLQTDVLDYSPSVVFVEFPTNDSDDVSRGGDRTNGFIPAAEALLRNIMAGLSNSKIILPMAVWPDNYSSMTADRRTSRDAWIALAANYSLPQAIAETKFVEIEGESYTDGDVENYWSGVHPLDAGHNLVYWQLVPYMRDLGGNVPNPLPARVYAEAADYEETPIIRTGVDNDGETGTGWSDAGTARQSSTADDTIAWTGTFCSFGLDTNYSVGAGTLAWKVDSGDYTNLDLSTKGVANKPVWNFTRGAHTVTLKVVSGDIVINRFLAI